MATVAMDYSVGALATFDLESQTLTENIASVPVTPSSSWTEDGCGS